MAATAIATGNQTAADAQDSGQAKVISAEPTQITLNVNGEDRTVTVEPRVTLLTVLRNDLNLTGAKDADDHTATGTDTVMIDDQPVLAGSRLAVECVGKKIVTIESLTAGGQSDDVIDGFVKHDAMQCGFCTPGFVMATRAYLMKNPDATLEEIRKGLGGNLCRCGTYQGITKCALEIAGKGGA